MVQSKLCHSEPRQVCIVLGSGNTGHDTQHTTDLMSGQYLEGLSRSTSNAGWQKVMPWGDPRGRTVQV